MAYSLRHVISRNPSCINYGLLRNKGIIVPGYDADFVIWDPYEQVGPLPEGMTSLSGVVNRTVARGKTIFEAESFFESKCTAVAMPKRRDVVVGERSRL